MKIKESETRIRESEVHEDVWIPTQCRRCQAGCGILAHRVDGVVVRLEGNPNTSSGSKGGMCPRGLAGLQVLYDPNRLNVPLKRTNPEKGIGVDPKWKEISWDEALDEIAARLKKVMDEDPRKILVQSGTSGSSTTGVWRGWLHSVLSTPKGMPTISCGGTGVHCGNGLHPACLLGHGAWGAQPDTEFCNYLMQFGTSMGFGAKQLTTKHYADAIARGMKLALFDPVCNLASSKATEWIPILPGTDGAVGLAMLNVIVNELGIYDAVYLKSKTNAPYLIGPDGRYIRDRNSNKPMVWDVTESKAKSYNDPSIGDFALDGIYNVNGTECRPAWQVLKEHFKKYTPEQASEISTVPAAIIRRVATEFAKAAMIGANITIDGKQLPLRPVATITLRGATAHQNAMHSVYIVDLLSQVLGACDVPGGLLGPSGRCLGYREGGLPWADIIKDEDGLLITTGIWFVTHKGWPLKEPHLPSMKDLRDLFVLEEETPIFGLSDEEEILQKAGVGSDMEVMLAFCTNPVVSLANPRDAAKILRKIPFIVGFELFLTETLEGFADIVLPDTNYLEYSDWTAIRGYQHQQTPVLEPWCFHMCQAAVKPKYERRHAMDVTLELLDRMGLRAKDNEFWNIFGGFDEANKIKPTEKITWAQLGDKMFKRCFGPEHDWEWFKKHGFISWPKKIEEIYWRYFVDARVPIYREFMIDLGEKIPKIAKGLGIEMDWKQYTALPEWFPCPPHLVKDPQYDLYCFSYRDPLQANSCTMEQPWIDEASRMNPYTYNIMMNADVAEEKGLKDGDTVELESDKGNKVQGVLKLKKAQHRQAVAIMGTAGHWATGQPIARGKGVHFNSLMELRLDECDPISLAFETCVKVKVTKVK
jgi:anaerobic selenocysteine-containing dehydrogenase